MQQNKLVYLDGLKGFGCVCVFLTHFVFAFYYGMYHYQPEACHLPDNLDIVIGKSPLNLLFNGNTAVRLFLVISGFVLCRSFFATGDKNRLKRSAAKRYFRLMPTVLVVNVVIWLAMALELYQNGPAAALAGSEEWFAGSMPLHRLLWKCLRNPCMAAFYSEQTNIMECCGPCRCCFWVLILIMDARHY